MLFTFLLVVHIIVATALVAVILMQRSEGGGLASGGNPGGLMSARGAADFLTRMTAILATIFVVLRDDRGGTGYARYRLRVGR